MPGARFEFLYPPLHALQEHLKQELARNPFFAPDDPEPHARDSPSGRDDDPPGSPPEDPDGAPSRGPRSTDARG